LVMSIDSRLAVVETHIDQIQKEGLRRETAQLEILKQIERLQTTVDDLNSTIVKYKGFIGGIVFVVGALGAFAAKFGTLIWQKVYGY